MQNDRKQLILQLQELAEKVKELKKDYRQKRPIIIEFSGSPKSGKTSCINSLDIFLKRNGFKTTIIQERASVCPVSDKKNPLFNIWTMSMSIAGMIGELESKKSSCDILILDRGIFDACCWFQWLSSAKMLDAENRKIIEEFALLDFFANKIDIVFSFTARPDISIKREYAHLLTEKTGSIMNNSVLGEYLQAIKDTINSKGKYFHEILSIDTSDKSQDEVGKEVTEKTLKTLSDALMERIGYCEPTTSEYKLLGSKKNLSFEETENILNKIKFDLREQVEKDKNKLQPIPIAVISDKTTGGILVVKKTSKSAKEDSPEHKKLLPYVGGHARLEDSTEATAKDFISVCKYTLRREMKEEIGCSLALDDITPFIIYTPDGGKSDQHIAICFWIKVDKNAINLRLDSEELTQNKGTTKSGHFLLKEELIKENNFEAWGKEILKHCFNINIGDENKVISRQRTLFDYLD